MQIREQFLTKFTSDKLTSLPLSQGLVASVIGDRAILKVSGEDAEDYLQNQLTNDVRLITSNQSQFSGWCTPKGRVIVTFRIYKQANDFFLIMDASLIEKVMKRLQMFIMRSKVILTDVTQTVLHLGLIDPDKALINHLFEKQCLLEVNQTQSSNNNVIMRLPDTQVERYEVMLEEASLISHLLDNPLINWITTAKWRYFDIDAGMPHVSELSSEAWIPQMLNMQVIDGVSFDKGCFPGQEIIARLKYLGKNKRRIYHLRLASTQSISIGEVIIDSDNTEVGKILNISPNKLMGIDMLAVLKIALADKPLSLNDQPDALLQLIDLPYPVADDS